MSVKTICNSRNESASTDGTRWWFGTDCDETTVALSLLQPVSELFPRTSGNSAIDNATVAKARRAFVSAIRKTRPTVSPESDFERMVLRRAWDDAVAFASLHEIEGAGVPVFDGKLMVVGTADATFKAGDGKIVTYCYSPECFEFGGETNAIVRILHGGFPILAEDDPHGFFSLKELARAILALLNRTSTDWSAKHANDALF